MKSPVHKDESADLAEHIGDAWDDLTGSVLGNEVWKGAGAQARGLKVLRRWKDINKRDVEKPTYRSRVVAIEFNTSQMDGLFAVTAPLEALRLRGSDAATVEKCPDSAFKEETKAITVNDVAIAFFEAFVAEGDCNVKKTVGPGCPMVGLLQKSLHGIREMQPRTSRKKFRNS